MNEWISVHDRLPDKNGRYLVCVKGIIAREPYIKIVSFAKTLKYAGYEFEFPVDCDDFDRPGFYDGDGEGDYEVTGVTHWMQLPNMPKETRE